MAVITRTPAMSRPQRDALPGWALAIRRIVAALALGAVGRALSYAALDAFLVYVFGDPAAEAGAVA